MATTTSTASPANHNALLAALLCTTVAAASFLPAGSSAAAGTSYLITQTCRRTSNPPLCVSLLQSNNRSLHPTTVHELAVVAVTAARRSALRARLRASIMRGDVAAGTPADRVVRRCNALYADCVRAGAKAVGAVSTATVGDDAGRAADAVRALRLFPETCGTLLRVRRVAPWLEEVSWQVAEELGVAAEVVRLLRR
ncbi:hypothetical protein U9M48_020482 [Paspalum notatum var. saurae]|uniref:Pectinesterase inhibitor domain-containing protein n=1 Tax=Paspalum notatum var. saurae TaxID=547442 RepID=A0AAQ3TEV8_PASNO